MSDDWGGGHRQDGPADETRLGPHAVWHDVGAQPGPGWGAPATAPPGGSRSPLLVVALVVAVLVVLGLVGAVAALLGRSPSAPPPLAVTPTAAATAPSGTPAATGSPVTAAPVSASADCQAAPAVDAAGARNTYEPAKAFDGAYDTAWRCEGDAAGRTITFDLGRAVDLTSVGLVPGYDKVDPGNGADRFLNSRRIQRARWVLDDGSSVEVTPAGARGMTTQAIAPTRTRSVRLVVEETLPGQVVASSSGQPVDPTDYTSVSEVAFQALG